MREVVDKLVEWLRSSVKEANCKGIVYGLSGGVDSVPVVFNLQLFPVRLAELGHARVKFQLATERGITLLQ